MSGIRNLKRVALDSNIFIYNLEQNPKFIEFTDSIFETLISNKLIGITSIITLVEILSYRQSDLQAAKITDDFFETPNLEIVELNRKVATEAAKIRRNYGFLLPDAVQIATAIDGSAATFITNDKRLKVFKQLPITLLTEIK